LEQVAVHVRELDRVEYNVRSAHNMAREIGILRARLANSFSEYVGMPTNTFLAEYRGAKKKGFVV
jgi:hypothetical protein